MCRLKIYLLIKKNGDQKSYNLCFYRNKIESKMAIVRKPRYLDDSHENAPGYRVYNVCLFFVTADKTRHVSLRTRVVSFILFFKFAIVSSYST